MRTPDGQDCRFYYQDFHRGREKQECRLQKENPNAGDWVPSDCAQCPVPSILRANASAYLELTWNVRYKYIFFGRTVEVTTHCAKHNIPIADPHVGCEKCNAERPGLDLFLKALEEDEPDSNPHKP